MYLHFFKRLFYMLIVLLLTIVVIFTLMYLSPIDPALSLLGTSATKESVQAIHEDFGLDDPYFVQLGRYLSNLMHGDLGVSYRSKTPVFDELMARYPTTLKITFGSVLVGILIGVPAGIYSAVRQYSVFDRLFTSISLFGASAPSFWTGMLLVLVFSLRLHWLPATGSYGFEYWILPILTMGVQTSASFLRMTRSCMLEVIRQDYVRTAKAKGQTEFKVVVKHALRNALIPILTVTGMKICYFLGGAVLIESVFAMPGLGTYIKDSVLLQDFPVVQGGIVLICSSCIIVTFIVDILYMLVDPRIKTDVVTHKLKPTIKSKPTVSQ